MADEVRRGGDHLQAPRGQAGDEVELVALPPVAEGKDRHPGAGLAVTGAAGKPQPDVEREGALAQLQHHPIGPGHLAEMGAGAADGRAADEQRRRQLDEGWRGVEQTLGFEHEVVVPQADAAAQLVAVELQAGAERIGEAAKAVARIAVQGDALVGLLGSPWEDGDRAPARRAGALVEGMAAVAV